MKEPTSAPWIAGLMAENYEAVGFIPLPTIEQRYMKSERFVMQHDETGRRVGYILHGAVAHGRTLTIAQHCIQHESRMRGYGEQAFAVVRERAERSGASAIALRCAVDLAALEFWTAQGFLLRDVAPGGKQRNRKIARMWLPLALPLFGQSTAPGIASEKSTSHK